MDWISVAWKISSPKRPDSSGVFGGEGQAISRGRKDPDFVNRGPQEVVLLTDVEDASGGDLVRCEVLAALLARGG